MYTQSNKSNQEMRDQMNQLHPKADIREHADAARENVRQRKARLQTAEDALAASVAQDKQEFTDAMEGYLRNVKDLADGLDEKAKSKAGAARADAEAAVSDVRRSRDAVAERLAEARQETDERWRERKHAVAASVAELDRKVEDALKKIQ